MTNHIKYHKISRASKAYNFIDSENPTICIQEKLDGANASFQYDKENDCLVAFSRNQTLSEENGLRGFYQWVASLDKEKVQDVLGSNLRVFCEWLVRHAIDYPDEHFNKAYCFDVYDTNTETYLNYEVAKNIIESLGLQFVPVFYYGEYKGMEHIANFVGQTKMEGCKFGEGVVVKNMNNINHPKHDYYCKFVGEQFVEKKGDKTRYVDPNKLIAYEERLEASKTIITEARAIKLLNKMVDEGILEENWGHESLGIVAKTLPKMLFTDCVEEEKETVDNITNFGKFCCTLGMAFAKDYLEKGKV